MISILKQFFVASLLIAHACAAPFSSATPTHDLASRTVNPRELEHLARSFSDIVARREPFHPGGDNPLSNKNLEATSDELQASQRAFDVAVDRFSTEAERINALAKQAGRIIQAQRRFDFPIDCRKVWKDTATIKRDMNSIVQLYEEAKDVANELRSARLGRPELSTANKDDMAAMKQIVDHTTAFLKDYYQYTKVLEDASQTVKTRNASVNQTSVIRPSFGQGLSRTRQSKRQSTIGPESLPPTKV